MLKVGISEVDITPAPGLPRAGMPYPQKGQGVAWPLMGRIFVFDDGIRQAAIVTLDLLFLTAQTAAEFRQAMTVGTLLAPTDVMVACTHTHWAPHTAAIMDEDADFAYLDFVRARLVEGLSKALAARRPARLKVGRIDAPGWAFNRRPVYRTPLGEQVGTQGPQWIPEFLRMEGPEDPSLSIFMAEGADTNHPFADTNHMMNGAPLGGLVNFTCHTTIGPDDPLYSADFPGPMAESLARRFGGVYGFLQGCAGNIWPGKMAKPRPRHEESGTTYTRQMGEALAEKAAQAIESGSYIPADGEHPVRVRIARQVLRIPQRRPTLEQVQLAKWFLEKRPVDADLRDYHRKISGHEYTFYRDWAETSAGTSALNGDRANSDARAGALWQEDWFARGTLGLWEWQRRAGTRELLEDVEVQVILVGDGSREGSLAFVGYPAEYFVEFGLRTKAQSPFAYTFVSEVTNGWHGYVPTLEAFQHGGYETRLGDASRLAPEAGGLICDTAVQLLHQLVGA